MEEVEETSLPLVMLKVYAGGGLWLHEARARTFPSCSTRCRNVVGLEVAARGLIEVASPKAMKERERERMKGKKGGNL